MNPETAERFEEAVAHHIENNEGDYHDYEFGRLHPSHISGCPLGTVIDFMTEKEIPTNNHMFNGTCVHYFLQEEEIINRALHEVGYHHINTTHEVPTHYKVEDVPGDLRIVGKCDTLATHQETDERVVVDIKYSSLKPEYNNNRLLKYAAQINTYAHMFNADRWVLLFIHSKADDITSMDSINTLCGDPEEENWNIMLEKAKAIHKCLDHFDWDEGNRWTKKALKKQPREFWEEVMQFFEEEWVPAYDGELKWSDRDEWVLPYTNEWDGTADSGLASFKNA